MKIAGKRIDLVVEGGQARLAVELMVMSGWLDPMRRICSEAQRNAQWGILR